MKLTQPQLAFFALLRAGLWEKVPDAAEHFPLDQQQWTEVYQLARSQTVVGLVYKGLSFLPDHLLPPDALLFRLAAEADVVERQNLKMNEALTRLVALFYSEGLRPILLKGQGIAQAYVQPSLRSAGDIDLYFPTADFARAGRIVADAGITAERHPDGSLCYAFHGVVVEHHPELIDLQNPSLAKPLAELEARFGFEEISIADARVLVPSSTLNLLLLSSHILKHAVGKGIGLRQLCDMARACHSLAPHADLSALGQIISAARISAWHDLLGSFLADHLALPSEQFPLLSRRVSSDPLLRIVLAGGNFGQYNSKNDVANAPVARRKLLTACSFARNSLFSVRYAPAETFWTVVSLFKGQF